jgi:hypothetical protein
MRRLLLSFALTLALSAVGASSALAEAPEGAQKSPIFGPEVFTSGVSCEGAVATPKQFGFVVLDTPGDETTVSGELSLKHVAKETTLIVELFQGAPSFACMGEEVGKITTNRKGNGNLHFTHARFPGSSEFFILAGNPTEFLASHVVELD